MPDFSGCNRIPSRSSTLTYMSASEHILDTVDAMLAVWDGQPSAGYSGTG
jgi:hypothetical protein